MNIIFPSVSAADVDRWDREWMHYFATEDRRPYLIESARLSVIQDLRGFSSAEVFGAYLVAEDGTRSRGKLRIWVDGDALVGKNVLEIGCGCGWLGKRLGLICAAYLGIDYSEVALAVARGVCPPNCRCLHISQMVEIRRYAGQIDTMVGREFFIHQNFDNALWALRLGSYLLKPGGDISADFYLPNSTIRQGVVHPARSPLDPRYASCAFYFRQDEVEELATILGLRVVSITDNLDNQRCFVTFKKPS